MVAGFDFGPGFDGGVLNQLAESNRRDKPPRKNMKVVLAVVAAIVLTLIAGLAFYGIAV